MRLKLWWFGIILIFSFFWIKLFYLQIIKGDYYLQRAIINKTKLINFAEPRGRIFDRNGEILAKNKLSLNLYLLPLNYSVNEIKRTLNLLKEIIPLNAKKILLRICKNPYKRVESILLKEDLTKEELIYIFENLHRLKGIYVQAVSKRIYPEGEIFSHIVGYIGSINKEEFKRLNKKDYLPSDSIGKLGVEASYEHYLKGRRSKKYVEVDVLGRFKKILKEEKGKPGADIFLTIDKRIQKKVYQIMKEEKGVCIVMNPKNGEILALCSTPDFDPNIFINGPNELRIKILQDKDASLLNRAVQFYYSPGSIFKIITTIAALEEGIISPNDYIICKGRIKVGDRYFKCYKNTAHGEVNLKKALAFSCNIYFYELGSKLGPYKICQWAKKLGISQISFDDFPYQKKGHLPYPHWKLEKFKEPWYIGETFQLSTGQGYIKLTPLELLSAIASIMSNGKLPIPHLVDKVIDIEEKKIYKLQPKVRYVNISTHTVEILREALVETVEYGTAKGCKLDFIKMAGKTGTTLSYNGKENGLFICFAPAYNPEVAILVIIEGKGPGPLVAVPIAKRILLECKDFLFKNESS